MVVNSLNDLKIKIMEAQPLKFGMDRILSEDISSTGSRKEEKQCLDMPPCAGCLSSLYRSCQVSTSSSTGTTPLYRSGIHAPQPLRPYTNVLIQSDSNIHLNSQPLNTPGGNTKRKRSWSRAVFSNLQRKGLEKRFQLQKYITKPDRRQLAATLGLTDAQVKVWFQNRRMKWRHTKESSRTNSMDDSSSDNLKVSADSTQEQQSDSSECGSDIDVQTVDS